MIIVLLSLFCSACSNNNRETEKSNDDSTSDIILPNVSVSDANCDGIFQKATPKGINGYRIMEKLGDYYWGIKSEYDEDKEEIIDEDMLLDINSNTLKKLKYPKNFPQWLYGATRPVVLKDRYLYEWRVYADNNKLTCVDSKTGEVKIIDENNLFNNLCCVDDTHLLSYYTVEKESNTESFEHSVVTVATLYDVDGNKSKIIEEEYKIDNDLINNEGFSIEHFSAHNGTIYALVRHRNDGKDHMSLCSYNINGDMLNKKEIIGLNKIMNQSMASNLSFIGDYIVFTRGDISTSYICKMTNNKLELIAKGITPIVSDKYIYFIKDNVNSDHDMKYKETNLYEKAKKIYLYGINIDNGKISKLNLPVPLENPYFVDVWSLPNNDLLFSYCEDDYDPLKIIQFILPQDKVNSLFDKCK